MCDGNPSLDLSEVTTPAFSRLWVFRNAFDGEFKVTIGAFEYLQEMLSRTRGEQLAGDISAVVQRHWHNRLSADELVQAAEQHSRTACHLGVVQVHAAVDDFLTLAVADLSRWRDFSGGNGGSGLEIAPSDEDGDDRERISVECSRQGWSVAEMQADVALLALFRTVRDCVAHRSARASNRLCVALADDAARLGSALGHWNSDQTLLPNVVEGQEFRIEPRAVILCLEVAVRACRVLDRHIINEIGESGVIYLAAYHSLFRADPLPSDASTSPDAIVNDCLHTWFGAYRIAPEGTVRVLRELGVWDRCHAAWIRRQRGLAPNVAPGTRESPH